MRASSLMPIHTAVGSVGGSGGFAHKALGMRGICGVEDRGTRIALAGRESVMDVVRRVEAE